VSTISENEYKIKGTIVKKETTTKKKTIMKKTMMKGTIKYLTT
jgi:hypothetical protein